MPTVAKLIPAFCFMDESGTLLGEGRYFGLGAIVHPWPDALIERLQIVFTGLVDACKKDRTAQEFHFTDVTKGTLRFFLKALDVLESDADWRFFSVILDTHDPRFSKPTDPLAAWACYLRWTKIMLQRNLRAHEKVTLIADFYRRPNVERAYHFATLPAVVPQLWDVLQVESHGVLMVQMADVILGSSLYSGISEPKNALSKRVSELRARLIKPRFNEWRVQWGAK